MQKSRLAMKRLPLGVLLPALMLLGLGCTSQLGTTSQAPQASSTPSPWAAEGYTDPFAYCAAVGTVDSPGSSYIGTTTPDEIITGFKAAAGLEVSSEPLNVLRKTTMWRCMGGKVYACNFGANLPCDSKADTASEPSTAMTDYCQSTPDSTFIPMSVTGHATIYSWHCVGQRAATLAQIDQADAAGYLERIWYQVLPSP
jgi:hypothetical protein